jgi:hypothetical protein
MIKYISTISIKAQNHIMYGTKLIANSATKLSRKKYNQQSNETTINNIISI